MMDVVQIIGIIIGALVTINTGVTVWILTDYLKFRSEFFKLMTMTFVSREHCDVVSRHITDELERFVNILTRRGDKK